MQEENMSVNWIAAYNRLFIILDREGETYFSGPSFLKMAQQVDPGVPNYNIFIKMRNQQRLSTTRRDFYWDVIDGLNEEQKYQIFRLFFDTLEPHVREEIEGIRALVFGGGTAVPTTVMPSKAWGSEKLNTALRDIDNAIELENYNRAVTLSYTCLEGLYKAYIQECVPEHNNVTELITLARHVKNDIAGKLKSSEKYPEQIVNAIPTITNAVANSRNSFSESHFDNEASRWLAIFTRDLVNSIGRLLLHFM